MISPSYARQLDRVENMDHEQISELVYNGQEIESSAYDVVCLFNDLESEVDYLIEHIKVFDADNVLSCSDRDTVKKLAVDLGKMIKDLGKLVATIERSAANANEQAQCVLADSGVTEW
ncbi:MAG: hypothetical protein ACXADB_09930 [Candidatus Hermodarchaeia archaeon]|jgi:hypothetical protein